MTRKRLELKINNSCQLAEDTKAPRKRKMMFRHRPIDESKPRGRSGKPKIFTPEEIAEYVKTHQISDADDNL